jgi:hypothetical protein
MLIKPTKKQVLKTMVKDPLTIISIFLPVVIFYLLISGMPRNYPGITNYYVYALILTGFAIYARYNVAVKGITLKFKMMEVDQIMNDLNTIMKTTTSPPHPSSQIQKKPVKQRAIPEEDIKDFQ